MVTWRSRATLTMCLWLAFSATTANAQVARQQTVPRGNLFESVSNPTALETDATRAYGGVANLSRDLKWRDSTTGEGSGTLLSLGFDKELDQITLSAGYSLFDFRDDVSAPGVDVSAEQSIGQIVGQFAYESARGSIAAFRVVLVNEERDISAGVFSGNASHSYTDMMLGGRIGLSESLLVGVVISPAVSSKARFDGAFSGVESRAGHGAEISLGIGIRLEDLSLGADFRNTSEERNAEDPAARTYGVSAEYKLGLHALAINVEITPSDQLRDAGTFITPAANEIDTTLSYWFQPKPGSLLVGLEYLHSSADFMNFGDATADADRLDSETIDGFFVTVTGTY